MKIHKRTVIFQFHFPASRLSRLSKLSKVVSAVNTMPTNAWSLLKLKKAMLKRGAHRNNTKGKIISLKPVSYSHMSYL